MIKPSQSSRAAVRSSPYPTTKPTSSILLGPDRQSRKRKSLSWQPDNEILKVRYFEYIADERINVTRVNTNDQQKDTNASANLASGSSLNNAQNKLSNSAAGMNVSLTGSVDPVDRLNNGKHDLAEKEYSPWLLVPIDFAPELPSPGWNSMERTAQAEREQYVLGAIDLPGLPSILDEPDNYNATTTSSSSDSATKEGESAKLIPLDSDEGVDTSYTNDNMYNSEIVNGVRISADNTNLQQQQQHHHHHQQQQLQQQMTIPNGVWTTPYPWIGIQATTRAGPVEGEIHNLFSHTRYF